MFPNLYILVGLCIIYPNWGIFFLSLSLCNVYALSFLIYVDICYIKLFMLTYITSSTFCKQHLHMRPVPLWQNNLAQRI